jgi:hypothetical protein
MSRRTPLVVLLVLAAACAHHRVASQSVDGAAPQPQPGVSARGVVQDSVAEYFGFYRWPFEHSEFVACGTPSDDRPWWVVPTGDALRQRDSLAAIVSPGAKGPVFVRVRGVVGARLTMGAGHMGGSTRYFRLFEVLDMRKADGAMCPMKS